MPAAAGQGYVLPDPAQGSFNRKWNWTGFHRLFILHIRVLKCN
jgi:hypothetical protein